MVSLLSCLPVCLTFVALGIVGLIAYASGAILLKDRDAEPATLPSTRPPLWIAAATLLVALLILLLLSLVTEGKTDTPNTHHPINVHAP